MDVLLIVDMQVGLPNGDPKHDLPGVIDRINRLGAGVRAQSGVVIFIQHCVDATVRSAVTNRHNVVVATDAHTLSDRPHLDALGVKPRPESRPARHHRRIASLMNGTTRPTKSGIEPDTRDRRSRTSARGRLA